MSLIERNAPPPNRSEPPKRPQAHAGGLQSMQDKAYFDKNKKLMPHNSSFFRDQGSVSKTMIFRDLKSPATKSQLKKDLKLVGEKELNEEVDKIKAKIDKVSLPYINKSIAQRIMQQDYQGSRRDIAEKMKDGLTSQETRDIGRGKKLTEFLKKKFGLK